MIPGRTQEDGANPEGGKPFSLRRPHSEQKLHPLMILDGILDYATHLAERAVSTGGIAIDATVGNGHDTLSLARAVGDNGRVYGFDIQPHAIDATYRRLTEAGVASRVSLIRGGHEHMDEHLPASAVDRVDAIMFNLGYLPGGDKSLTTVPETTVAALDHAIHYLKPGGVITVVQYAGHEGGAAEAEAVDAWAAALDQENLRALSYRFVNQRNAPPRLLAVERTHRAGT